jgi:hypothetical protein
LRRTERHARIVHKACGVPLPGRRDALQSEVQ